jgi:glycerophosphoryl diester phosphodiesterase
MHIIAHRGGAEGNIKHENSLRAIKRSLTLEIYAIELDLRWDGEDIVLSHDRLLDYRKCPTLKKVLETVKGKKVLILEIKEKEVIKPLSELLIKYSDKVIVSSFEYSSLVKIKKLMPRLEVAILEKWSGIRATRYARHLKTKKIHMNERWLWRGFVWMISKRGYKLYAYTINSSEQARKLKKAGIAGVFTDYPEKMTIV